MKKNIITLVKLGSLVAVLEMSAPAQAEMSRNSIGPSLTSTNSGLNFGIDAKIGIINNFSVRPFAYFPSGGSTFGSALTYDLNFRTRDGFQLAPFLGGSLSTTSGTNSQTVFGLVVGSDFPLSDTFGLNAALHMPLSNKSNQTTGINLGAEIRF